jgi:hypothetical protein
LLCVPPTEIGWCTRDVEAYGLEGEVFRAGKAASQRDEPWLGYELSCFLEYTGLSGETLCAEVAWSIHVDVSASHCLRHVNEYHVIPLTAEVFGKWLPSNLNVVRKPVKKQGVFVSEDKVQTNSPPEP